MLPSDPLRERLAASLAVTESTPARAPAARHPEAREGGWLAHKPMVERKTYPATRAAAKTVAPGDKPAAEWAAAHPAEADWLRGNYKSFDFAASLMGDLRRFGHLTDNQLAAVQSCMARDQARAEQAASRVERSVEVNVQPIIDAFARASNAMRKPILRTPEFRFSKASATGANAGAIYVKTLGTEEIEGQYLGKLMNGRFHPSRECTPEQQARIVTCCADPVDAVLRYARLTGNCGICGRELQRADSIERGIGPVCWGRFFGG